MRKAGLLMPVSALPSDYGVGDFGKGSREFIDIMKECGLHIWQILPLNPLGYGNISLILPLPEMKSIWIWMQ